MEGIGQSAGDPKSVSQAIQRIPADRLGRHAGAYTTGISSSAVTILAWLKPPPASSNASPTTTRTPASLYSASRSRATRTGPVNRPGVVQTEISRYLSAFLSR